MYRMEVSCGVSSSKNIIPMFSKNPRHWLIRFVIGCGQFWLVPRTAEETNDLDTQRNQAGGAFRVCDSTNNKVTASSQSGLESRASVFRAKRQREGIRPEAHHLYALVRNIQVPTQPPGFAGINCPEGKMPDSRAPTCVRPAVATSRPVPQGKLDTVPHTQLVVEGSKTVLEEVLGGSNFASGVPVTEAEGDDALFPFSWASLPVKIMSEHRRLLYIKVASLTRLMPLVMPKRKNRRLK